MQLPAPLLLLVELTHAGVNGSLQFKLASKQQGKLFIHPKEIVPDGQLGD